MAFYVVRLERGGPWDWARDMRQQAGWDEHARFLDDLVDAGFILLGGPLEGDRDTLHIVEAESEGAIRERLKEDPWATNGMLRPVRIERWTVVLDGRGLTQETFVSGCRSQTTRDRTRGESGVLVGHHPQPFQVLG